MKKFHQNFINGIYFRNHNSNIKVFVKLFSKSLQGAGRSPAVFFLSWHIWSMNPGLTGPEVRNIIIETAQQSTPITDTRDDRDNIYWQIDAFRAAARAYTRQSVEHFRIVGFVSDATIENDDDAFGMPLECARVMLIPGTSLDEEALQFTYTCERGFFRQPR